MAAHSGPIDTSFTYLRREFERLGERLCTGERDRRFGGGERLCGGDKRRFDEGDRLRTGGERRFADGERRLNGGERLFDGERLRNLGGEFRRAGLEWCILFGWHDVESGGRTGDLLRLRFTFGPNASSPST